MDIQYFSTNTAELDEITIGAIEHAQQIFDTECDIGELLGYLDGVMKMRAEILKQMEGKMQ